MENVGKKSTSAKMPEWLAEHFVNFEASLNGQKASPVHEMRKAAFEKFQAMGLPHAKLEEWRYTNISKIGSLPLQLDVNPVCEEDVQLPAIAEELDAYTMAFVDGGYAEKLSSVSSLDVQGIHVASLKDVLGNTSHVLYQDVLQNLSKIAPTSTEAFVALNTAFVNDGVVLKLEKGAKLDKMLYCPFITSVASKTSITHPRMLVIAEDGSEAQLVQHFVGQDEKQYLTSGVVELVCGKNTNLTHITLQEEGSEAVHVSAIDVYQEESSHVQTYSFSLGGALVRNEVRPVLDGENIMTEMLGLSVLDAKQHVDNTTVIDHAKPNCESFELYKGIYADESKGVFSGTIIVRPDAQKTNAIQSSQGLLISERASCNSRPQLKIWADDVKCTHGATVGQLDDDALFYLMARGISKRKAQSMLVRAFSHEVIDKLESEPLHDYVEMRLINKLEAKLDS